MCYFDLRGGRSCSMPLRSREQGYAGPRNRGCRILAFDTMRYSCEIRRMDRFRLDMYNKFNRLFLSDFETKSSINMGPQRLRSQDTWC